MHIDSDDQHTRQKLIDRLGFKSDEIIQKVTQVLGRAPGSLWRDQSQDPKPVAKKASPMLQPVENAEDFFSNLAQQQEDEEMDRLQNEQELKELQLAKSTSDRSDTDWNAGPEALIRQSFLVGNREAAVEICLKSGRMADALLIAHSDPQLFQVVRDEYLKQQNDPFLNTMGLVVRDELEGLVENSDLSQWKETLALLATYATNERGYAMLCEKLAERLQHEKFDVR